MIPGLMVKDLTEIALIDGLAASRATVEVAGLVDWLAVLPADVVKVAGLRHGTAGLLLDSTPGRPRRFPWRAKTSGEAGSMWR